MLRDEKIRRMWHGEVSKLDNNSSEKSIVTLGYIRWPQTAKQHGDETRKNKCMEKT